MKKAWIYTYKNRPGIYVRWYDTNGKYRCKQFPTKALRLSRSQLEVRWPLHDESYAPLTFLATPCCSS